MAAEPAGAEALLGGRPRAALSEGRSPRAVGPGGSGAQAGPGSCSRVPSASGPDAPRQVAFPEETSVSRKEYEAAVRRLQEEQSAHARTKDLLTKESEKLDFALGEVEVLSRQLRREREIFEKTLDSIKSKALTELTQKDNLINKCNEIKSCIVKQEDVLKDKEKEIQALHRCIAQQKQTLKTQVSELKIQKQQELYIAQVLEKKQRKGFK
ncbi:spermatogenesis-associated protein 24 [Rhea pennata]|uniref:spermatogenesis-associated protein 24 n=1 Tax=Rhea pennata TaxID=8795 RepID=UPI002E259A1A